VRRLLAAAAAVLALLSLLVSGDLQASAAVRATTAGALTAGGVTAGAGTLRPVEQVRVFDTRRSGRLIPARTVGVVPVVGQGTVPTSGVAAVVANLTVLAPAKAGSLSVYPGGTGWTGASTMSFPAKVTSQSMVTVPVGANGALSVRNNMSVGLQLVVDVLGYYLGGQPVVAGGYRGTSLTRVLSARPAPGQRPLSAHQVSTFRVGGVGAIPVNASAVIATVTVLTPTVAGSLSVFDPDTGWNASATVSFAPGVTFQTQVIGRLGAAGRLSVRNNAGVPVAVLVDVTGYFSAGPVVQPGALQPTSEVRVVNRRMVPAGSTQTESTTDVSGWPLFGPIGAIELNLTVLMPWQSGSLSVIGGDGPWSGSTTMTFQRKGIFKQTVLVQLGRNGTYRIRNNSGMPIEIIGDVTGYYRTAVPLGFGNPQPVEHSSFGINRLSCGSPTTCVALDPDGYAVYRNSAGWSRTAVSTPQFQGAAGVSCVSATWCMGTGKVAEIYDGSSWSDPLPGVTQPLFTTACTSTTWCLALDTRKAADGGLQDGYATFDGTGWSASADLPAGDWPALACASPTSCLAVSREGQALHYDGSGWSAAMATGVDHLTAVSCASVTLCLVIGNGSASRFDGTSWSVLPAPAPGVTLSRASCADASTCYANTSNGGLYSFDGTSWTEHATGKGTLLLACPAPGSCVSMTTGPRQAVTEWAGDTWTTPQYVDWVRGTMTSVSCPATDGCFALDSNGGVTRWDGTAWSTPADIDPPADRTVYPNDPAVAIECPSSTDCLVVDRNGQAVRYAGAGWQPPQQVPGATAGFNDVSCASVSFCLAVTQDGKAIPYDGQSFGTPVPLSNSAMVVSCAPGSSTCAVADSDGRVAVFTGRSWTPMVAMVGSGLPSVSCATASYCLVAANDGYTSAAWNGRAWTVLPRPRDPVPVFGLRCTAVAVCDGFGSEYAITAALYGNSWLLRDASPYPYHQPGYGWPHQLACSPDRTCWMADGSGNLITLGS